MLVLDSTVLVLVTPRLSTASATNKATLCPVVVGRASDLGVLQTHIEQLPVQHGTTLLVTGEAGIGKSRLVAEAKALATSLGYTLLQGNCFEQDRLLPFAPLIDLLQNMRLEQYSGSFVDRLQPYASDLISLAPSLQILWPDVVPMLYEPEQAKRRLFQVLANLFFSLVGHQQPIHDKNAQTPPAALLTIEDIHWCDDTTLEFLLSIARQLVHYPLLLVLTYRNDEVHPPLGRFLAALNRERLAHELALTRLNLIETASMIRAIFDLVRVPHGEFLNALYSLTDGNPLFIEEVLKACVAEGAIFQTGGQWGRKPLSQIAIPRTIQFAVQQRVQQLTPDAQQLLTLAAVAGQRCDFDLLLRASGYAEVQLIRLIKELVAAQLIVEEAPDLFIFRHALTRQAVYNSLLARERRLLHRTIAETLEQIQVTKAHSASLAYHFEAAALWEKTLLYARAAGEQAQIVQSPQAAIEQWTRALAASQQLASLPPADLLRARAQAYEQLGEFNAAHHDLDRALTIAQANHDLREVWQIVLDLGFLWSGRDIVQAGATFQEALALARKLDDPAALAHTLNRIGNWYVNSEQPQQGRLYHEEALAIFTNIGDEIGLAATIDLLAGALFFNGETVQGIARYAEAAKHFRRIGDRRGLASSLTWLAYRGPTLLNSLVALAPITECISTAEEALQLARTIGWRPAEGFAWFALGFCFCAQGEYGSAIAAGQAGMELILELEHAWEVIGRSMLGSLYLDMFAYPLAQEQLVQGRSLAQQNGSVLSYHVSSALLAATYVAQHDVDQAQHILDQLEKPVATPESFTLAQRLAELARAQLALVIGQPAQALSIVERLIATAQRLADDPQRVVPILLRIQGEALLGLERLDTAQQVLMQAQQAALSQDASAQLWRIEALLGNCCQRQGHRNQANIHFAQTRDWINTIAVSIPDTGLRSNFVQHALQNIPTFSTPTPLYAAKQAYDGLTERERVVATLIAQGKSDREIAELLILSKRTVSTHVSNILAKLGFSSRSQIAAWAVGKGL